MPSTTSEKALLGHYRKLHDGLSDMVEEGRLTAGDIPDDYQWLVTMLTEAIAIEFQIDSERCFAAARDHGWSPDDEDTPEDFCRTEGITRADLQATDPEHWRVEYRAWKRRNRR